jgi:hypothetical protein
LCVASASFSCASIPGLTSPVERDYVLRLIATVAAAIARIRRRRGSGDFAGARDEVHAASAELLGTSASLVSVADARTGADLLGDSRRIAAYGRLLSEDADLLHSLGWHDEARTTARRALAFLLEAYLRAGSLDTDGETALLSLRAQVLSSVLEPRYSNALQARRDKVD